MKALLRFFSLSAVLLFLPFLVRENLNAGKDVEQARVQYERARIQLETTTAELNRVERQLTRLTTSIGAVEDEVREQHRMVKPGETLVLIEIE